MESIQNREESKLVTLLEQMYDSGDQMNNYGK